MTQELSDSIKRLRRIGSYEWHSVDRDDAIQTINQLVELVVEMRDAASELLDAAEDGQINESNTHETEINLAETLTKADALLSGLKEDV